MSSPALELKNTPEAADKEFVWNMSMAGMEILLLQCNLSAQPMEPVTYVPLVKSAPTVSAEVDVVGKGVNAILHVRLPEKTFLGIVSKILGENFETMTKDIESGAMELVNIIFGAAKEVFGKSGVNLERAIPRMSNDQAMMTTASKARNTLMAKFDSDVGPFELFVAFDVKK